MTVAVCRLRAGTTKGALVAMFVEEWVGSIVGTVDEVVDNVKAGTWGSSGLWLPQGPRRVCRAGGSCMAQGPSANHHHRRHESLAFSVA